MSAKIGQNMLSEEDRVEPVGTKLGQNVLSKEATELNRR